MVEERKDLTPLEHDLMGELNVAETRVRHLQAKFARMGQGFGAIGELIEHGKHSTAATLARRLERSAPPMPPTPEEEVFAE